MKLEDYKKKRPFTVPEGYFDNLDNNIINMLPKKPATPQKQRRTINFANSIRYISYAATIAAIFILGGIALVKSNNADAEYGEELYSQEYIDEVLNNYPIDDYTFYCYVTDSDY